MLIRPEHSLKQIARADGKSVLGPQSCSSEQAKGEKDGAKAVLEINTTNEKTIHVPDANGQMNTRGANAGR